MPGDPELEEAAGCVATANFQIGMCRSDINHMLDGLETVGDHVAEATTLLGTLISQLEDLPGRPQEPSLTRPYWWNLKPIAELPPPLVLPERPQTPPVSWLPAPMVLPSYEPRWLVEVLPPEQKRGASAPPAATARPETRVSFGSGPEHDRTVTTLDILGPSAL